MPRLLKDPFVAHMTTAQLAVARADDALVKARLGGGCTRLRLRPGQAAFRQGCKRRSKNPSLKRPGIPVAPE